jgi:hypothetical protein
MIFVLYHIYKIYNYLRVSLGNYDLNKVILEGQRNLMTVPLQRPRSLKRSDIEHMQILINTQQDEINRARNELNNQKKYRRHNSPRILAKEREIEQLQTHLNFQRIELQKDIAQQKPKQLY